MQINALKEKYKDKIQIYLGLEEDAFAPTDRARFDYIVGSSHYFCIDGEYLPIDSSHGHFKKCLEAFAGDIIKMAKVYFTSFCDYINKRKPDIIGHFDLITKFDELEGGLFFANQEYNKVAEKYLLEAAKSECIFEVNTGAISRGIRSTVYPAENLLYLLKKQDGKLILSSDSHQIETLDSFFEESKKYLSDIGFTQLYTLADDKFVTYPIK